MISPPPQKSALISLMPDFLSKAQRSKHMGLVRSRNTRFEIEIVKHVSRRLYPLGYRYLKHYRRVSGTPDLAFIKHKVAVFFDSDFWHGRNYDSMAPRMNTFWRAKIERNMERDKQVNRNLRREGWKVLRFGERQVKRQPDLVVARIEKALEASTKAPTVPRFSRRKFTARPTGSAGPRH